MCLSCWEQMGSPTKMPEKNLERATELMHEVYAASCVGGGLRHLFDLAGQARTFNVFDTEDQAVESYR